jgi:hypothetical protein
MEEEADEPRIRAEQELRDLHMIFGEVPRTASGPFQKPVLFSLVEGTGCCDV